MGMYLVLETNQLITMFVRVKPSLRTFYVTISDRVVEKIKNQIKKTKSLVLYFKYLQGEG